MKNYEQLRALNAQSATKNTRFAGANDGEVVKKIPTMIRENGILGAMAFAVESTDKGLKNKGHYEAFGAIIAHLESVGLVEKNLKVEQFIQALCGGSATNLRIITAESLAYLSYLRRFARKDNNDESRKD